MCTLLRVGKSKLHELRRDKRIPEPIDLGAAPRWRAAEVLAWIAAGMPDPADWKWEPVRTIQLETYIKVLHAELVELNQELASVRRAIAAGETHTQIRR